MGGPGGSAPRLEKNWRFKGAKTPFLTKVFLTPPSPEPAQVAATHSETQPRRRQTHKHHVELTGNCDARTDATTAHTAHGDRCKVGRDHGNRSSTKRGGTAHNQQTLG